MRMSGNNTTEGEKHQVALIMQWNAAGTTQPELENFCVKRKYPEDLSEDRENFFLNTTLSVFQI